ncbi:aspartyl/asparaginyl beta-hydroxylase domain-containing protein [Arhodomonas sp. AD133]|uniref:aspartyl/asparaginyl beta-hydroxylase domain-containing protein n=1 Tax=Arhodomonas sp. AD133 TaxID=3415009 RepID=UPI003EB7E6A9
MNIALILLCFVAVFAGSIVYVYRFRGEVRYESFGQYFRKSWPIFAPLNCMLYFFTAPRARRAIMARERFPELDVIRDNWETIRAEAEQLLHGQAFEHTADPGAGGYYDVGFRTFYKYGWRKFYLKWYGYTHHSARASCPETLKILAQVPSVNGAMLTVLPPGGKLTPHSDPAACSLRYHLGLATPNDDACYINIDGTDHSWRDGQDLLFDETYRHYAHNDTDRHRLILMCDVERPTWLVGPVVNFVYKGLMRATVVPNTDDDRRGFANRVFARLSPLLADIRTLKHTNNARYQVIKHSANAVLLTLVAGVVVGAAYSLHAVVTLAG